MTEFEALPQPFYKPSAKMVAPELLGHWLIRNSPNGISGGAIVEVEAYLHDDPASHAFRGETPRNRVMWERHGCGYVYLIYGYHYCVNAVCQPAGIGEAVLIRAIEPVFGEQLMRKQRQVTDIKHLTSGPAKLCDALNIDRTLDGVDLCDSNSPLFIARNPDVEKFRKERGSLVTTTRIGITRAASLPLRFYLEGSLHVSRRIRTGKSLAKMIDE